MSLLVLTAALISTLHLEGDVPADGGDYDLVDFDVPAGAVEMEVTHLDGSDENILDFGLWDANGFRGWGGGLTDPTTIGVEAASRGYLPGAIVGAWQLVIGKARLSAPPGHYVADVSFFDTPTLAPQPRAPFAPVVLKSGPAWYSGDLHVHSRESGDAKATFDEIRDLAHSRGLDFVVLSDHNTVSQQGLAAAYQADSPDVLFVRGDEFTTYGGHGNALGIDRYIDHRVGLNGRTADAAIREVVAAGGFFIVNHPTLDLGGACIGCAWTQADTPWNLVGGIEIQNGNFDVTGRIFTPRAIRLWDAQMDMGERIVAVGGSDDHTAGQDEGPTGSPVGSPTTRVYATELSEAGLIDGLRAGRVVLALTGPDDPQVELTVHAADGTTGGLGDELAAKPTEAEVHVVGGRDYTVVVVVGGSVGPTAAIDSDDATVHVPLGDDVLGPSSDTPDVADTVRGNRIRAELHSADGRLRVLTNHVYATWRDVPATVDAGPVTPDAAPRAPDAAASIPDATVADLDGASLPDAATGQNSSGGSGGGCAVAPGRAARAVGGPSVLLALTLGVAARRRRTLNQLPFLLAATLAGCGVNTLEKGTTGRACGLGEVSFCTCPNGHGSSATCGSEGTYLPCQCGQAPPPDHDADHVRYSDAHWPDDAAPPPPPQDAAPFTPDTTPLSPDAAPVLPDAAPVAPDVGPVDAAPPPPDVPSAPPEPVRCAAAPESVAIDGFQIFRYEASHPSATPAAAFPGAVSVQGGPAAPVPAEACARPGVRPWHTVDWATARTACEEIGWRLCTEAELVRACGGPDGDAYTFGATFNAAACNLREAYSPPGAGVATEAPTGAFPQCRSAEGVYDLTGNLWEWAAEGPTYVGGGWRIIAEHHRDQDLVCDGHVAATLDFLGPDVGFRCCRDGG